MAAGETSRSVSGVTEKIISYYRDNINTDLLIEEVKIRPSLYSRDVKEYNDNYAKKKMWEEICLKLFPDAWKQLNLHQQELICKEVHKRWKNLRACFSRELRVQKEVGKYRKNSKRRKYIYFDKLLFLQSNIENDLTPNENENFEEDTADTGSLHDEEIHYPEIVTTSSFQPYVYEHKPQNELDYDTVFALSLVPMLKELPLTKKVDAQIKILTVLKEGLVSKEAESIKVKKNLKRPYDEQIEISCPTSNDIKSEPESDDSSIISNLFGDDDK